MKKKLVDYLSDPTQKVLFNSTGVYKIIFEGSDKCYIGSTTESFKVRFGRHLSQLKYKKHCNLHLQRAFDKYKIMQLVILEICEKEECIEREQYYIDSHDKLYNICEKAGNTLGFRFTEEQKEKMGIKVDVFNLDGEFLNTFSSITQASKDLNCNLNVICTAIKNGSGRAGKYLFAEQGKFEKLDKYVKPTSFHILMYSKEGEFVKEFDSILDATKETGIHCGNISRCVRGIVPFCNDYIFKNYENNYPLKIEPRIRMHKNQLKVTIEDQEGKIEIYDSFRTVPKHIIHRVTLRYKYKESSEFLYKNYKIIIEKIK